jgi:hypothetical protein
MRIENGVLRQIPYPLGKLLGIRHRVFDLADNAAFDSGLGSDAARRDLRTGTMHLNRAGANPVRPVQQEMQRTSAIWQLPHRPTSSTSRPDLLLQGDHSQLEH